jgi:hypothetical protein
MKQILLVGIGGGIGSILRYLINELSRKFFPNTFMEDFGLEKGFGVKRAMVFERPPVLPKLFT